jgi:hypothetical protein
MGLLGRTPVSWAFLCNLTGLIALLVVFWERFNFDYRFSWDFVI